MKDKKIILCEKATRVLPITIINTLTMLVTSLGVFFAAFYPVKQSLYKEKQIQMLADRETLNQIADESSLVHKFENGQYFTVYETYDYYVQILLKHNYEHSTYDLDKDVDNYKTKQEDLKLIPEIKVTEDSVDDRYVGKFYTSFIIDKADAAGNPVINFESKTAKEHFYYEVLDIDGEGAEFFQETTGDYPLLKDKVRKNLYDYNLLQALTNEAYDIDTKFFNYFMKITEKAGNDLMKYGNYAELLERHDTVYKEVQNYDLTAIIVSFSAGYLAVIVIFPLFKKSKQNPGELILSRIYLSQTNEGPIFNKASFIGRILYGIVKYFFVLFLLMTLLNIDLTFASLFYIGSFPISLFSITVITLLVNSVSLVCTMVRSDRKNLENLITRTRVYSLEKDLTSTNK